MTEYLRAPDLLIYLRASVDTLLHQISARGRDFERSIQREYLEQLNRHYESWIGRYNRGKLLVVESDSLDFVNKPEDLEKIVGMVRKTLRSPRSR
jgi:deoxyadenosine/deoxycytidine kinase